MSDSYNIDVHRGQFRSHQVDSGGLEADKFDTL